VLTVSLAALAFGAWALGVVIQDVVARDDLARLDHPVLSFFLDHRQPWLTTAMRWLTDLGAAGVLIPVVVVVGGTIFWRTRDWRPGALLAGAYGGAAGLSTAVKHLVGRPRPPVVDALSHAGGFAFPSGHATHAAAVYVVLGAVAAAGLQRRGAKTAALIGASVVVAAVGISRLYLGVHWLTDVVAGWLIGSLWALLLLVALRTAPGLWRASRGDDPASTPSAPPSATAAGDPAQDRAGTGA
jgi:undecaprenyl-diphosphatase